MKTVALIHTVKSVLLSFEEQLRAALPGQDLAVHNTLDEFLASDANIHGFTKENLNRLFLILKAADLEGADLIVVTCSTLTPGVGKIRPFLHTPVVAIDEAMMAKAAAMGRNFTILATAQSTVEPAKIKLTEECAKRGFTPEIGVMVCDDAYTAIKRLDRETHDRLLQEEAAALRGKQDVLILAQASMAHLEKPLAEICGCPVLSSPSLCLGQVSEILGRV